MHLEASGRHLEASGRHLEASGEHLEASGGIWEAQVTSAAYPDGLAGAAKAEAPWSWEGKCLSPGVGTNQQPDCRL